MFNRDQIAGVTVKYGHGYCVNSADDAVEAVRRGASGIVVSNHGGRQLDTVPAAVCLSVSL